MNQFLKLRLLRTLGITGVLSGVVAPTACGGAADGDAEAAGSGGQSPGAAGSMSGGPTVGGAPTVGEGGAVGIAGGRPEPFCAEGKPISLGLGGCCATTKCMPVEQAWALADVGSAGASGGGADGAAPACPADAEMPSGLCYGYRDAAARGDECCYTYWTGSCCGRPFVVGGLARDAGCAPRSDWLAEPLRAVTGLDAATREALASAWLRDAQLEHASVASFSRFVLQLLAVGAPAALVERAQGAIGDEVKHARLCFSLASRYAARALGPGRLDVDGSLGSCDLADVAARAVHEGCVGETLAALEAESRLAEAEDARVREALTIIRDDETAHAELAWAFVQWSIQEGGSAVRAAVERAFDEARANVRTQLVEPTPSLDAASYRAHGHILPAERVRAQQAAFREVIDPCRRALLHEPTQAGPDWNITL